MEKKIQTIGICCTRQAERAIPNKRFWTISLANGRNPVNFAASTHTTGGNSGSPVMNGDGELIGINFWIVIGKE